MFKKIGYPRYRIRQRKGGGWYLQKKPWFWSLWERFMLFDTEEKAKETLSFILK